LYSAMLFSVLVAIFGFSLFRVVKFLDKKSSVIFYLASFTLLFIAFTAIGRVCLGVLGAFTSRYVTYTIPGMIAIYFGILNFKNYPRLRYMFLAGFLLLLFAKETTVSSSNVINWFYEGKKNWVECYLQNRNIEECNRKANFKVYLDDKLIEKKLKFLEENNLSFFKDDE
ncbi:MAG: hypothetical protein K9H16_15255, partial [Bacteroidales bacterium]|nr:hypothetical protein [Bacteroidales bacterium]